MIGLVLAATLMFDFTGTCVTGCEGTATLHVDVTDAYVPGTLADGPGGGSPVDPILIDALYADNRQVLAFAPGREGLYEVMLPAVGGTQAGRVLVDDQSLRTFADGTWRWTGDGGTCVSVACDPRTPRHDASGTGAVWVDPPAAITVPWPAWVLLAGWGALIFWRRV